jgi:CxxC motif-containing protein
MKELICIVCPNGCNLKIEEIDGKITVTGAKCKKGEKFALEEMVAPMRTICTTMKTTFTSLPVVPVRTSKEIPKELIFELMKVVNGTTVDKKLKRGEVVIKNVLNSGADIIVTSDMTRY